MADNENKRVDKFEKRRKNTKLINYFIIFASIAALFLVAMWIFGGSSEETAGESQEEQQTEAEGYFLEVEDGEGEDEETAEVTIIEEEDEDADESREEGADEEENAEENQDVEIEVVESDDEDVQEAVVGNWPPVGTEQSGPHTTDYADGSQDRIEIRRAVSMVTGIPESDIVERWIGNGGDQKVIATVSDSALTVTYRVYLDWIDEEGWQPTRMETLVD
jgi:cobalamin biosynthesis protein CobT